MYTSTRAGARGGRADFKWSDVAADKDRENYLGHSIHAPVGRWQKNKDITWYNKDGDESDRSAERQKELALIKAQEEEAMAVAMGYAPTIKPTAPGIASSSARPGKEEETPEDKARRKAEKASRKAEKEQRKQERAEKRLAKEGRRKDNDQEREYGNSEKRRRRHEEMSAEFDNDDRYRRPRDYIDSRDSRHHRDQHHYRSESRHHSQRDDRDKEGSSRPSRDHYRERPRSRSPKRR